MKKEPGNYHAFLLRFWREDDRSSWHAGLENPHTGEKHTFTNPELLWAYIEAQMNPPKNHSCPNESKDE
jgi:hypothetical protein